MAVRLHADNPWTLDRLKLLREGHSATPPVVVVDFGSAPPYSDRLRQACEAHGLDLLRIEDEGVFSLARARNLGFRAARTPFVLFSDPDFVFRSGDFAEIDRLIGTLGLDGRIDQIVNFPAYHLGEEATARFEAAQDRDGYLERLAFDETYLTAGGTLDFTAPYSNVFLVNARFFEIVGGYDETFRGHGSEDFEFLTRAALHARCYRLPRRLAENHYSPNRLEFYLAKDFVGYRRLLEVIALPAELLGLKTFHLWHVRREESEWLQNNDWKRERLASSFKVYLDDWKKLLSVDFLPRPRTALCVCAQAGHDGYFYPLRVAGYRLIPLYAKDAGEIARAAALLDEGAVDAFAVFNPYMKSLGPFKPLFDKARAGGVRTIVVERGALPGTIYYADDVSYADPAFSEAAFLAESFSDEEIGEASSYVDRLREGGRALEEGASYGETDERWSARIEAFRRARPGARVIFAPLQLPEDMAVTMFLREAQGYGDYAASLADVVAAHPEALFVIKPHPLSGAAAAPSLENAAIAAADDNVHCLIDLADAVVCYNSGVGLLALLHQKPVVTVGNAFYNLGGIGRRAGSLAEAAALAVEGFKPPTRAAVDRLCAWFVARKYSTFIAEDDIRETPTRKIHAYRDILVTRLRLGDEAWPLGRMRERGAFAVRSYGSARLHLDDRGGRFAVTEDDEFSRAQGFVLAQLQSFVALFYPARLRNKMLRAPRAYLRDSTSPVLRRLGRFVFGRDL